MDRNYYKGGPRNGPPARPRPQQPAYNSDYPPQKGYRGDKEYAPPPKKPKLFGRKPKNNRQRTAPPSRDAIYGNKFKDFVSWAAKGVSQIGTGVILLVAMILFMVIDVAVGGFTMALVIERGIDFGPLILQPWFIAGSLSVVLSAVQVYLRLQWRAEGVKIVGGRQFFLGSLMAVDTLFDMMLPAWVGYGETPYTVALWPLTVKPAMFYVFSLTVGALCAMSEWFTVGLAELGEKM